MMRFLSSLEVKTPTRINRNQMQVYMKIFLHYLTILRKINLISYYFIQPSLLSDAVLHQRCFSRKALYLRQKNVALSITVRLVISV